MKQTGLTIVPQATSWSYDPKTGYKTRRSYKCTTQADLAATESSLKSGRWSYDVNAQLEDGSNGFWEITATRAVDPTSGVDGSGTVADEPISDTWELSSNLLEKDLLESDHDLILGMWDYSDDYLVGSETQEEVFSRGIQLLKDLGNDPKAVALEVFSPNPPALKLAKLIIAGVKSVRLFQPTLRHNKIVSDKYSVRDALTNCGNIIKASSLNSLESLPTTILFNLPSAYETTRSDAFGLLLKYGWFKKYPNVTELANDQWQISQEFEWGLWHENLYTIV